MIADRQRDIRRESERMVGSVVKSPTWRVRLKQSYIRVKPFLSPSFYIYIVSFSLCLLILTSSRLLFDCLLHLLRLLDPSVLYLFFPARSFRVP